jgi:hypothetical protein
MPDSSDVTGAAVQVRLEGPLFAELENWRRSQPKIIPRSWALRQLLERALACDRPSPRRTKQPRPVRSRRSRAPADTTDHPLATP